MSTFSKHNNLSTFLTCSYGTINLSGTYSILNENSNINVKNSSINSLIPSFIINNGVTNIINSDVDIAYENNIIIDNSKNYIDDQQYNNFKYSYVENGSIFPYSKVVLTPVNSFFDTTSNDYQLIIPINDKYKNHKDEYVKETGKEDFGTGNEFYSTHFLNNGNYGYWGNKFGGQWIRNVGNLNINSIQDFTTCINTIPRNLNGYQVTLIYKDFEFTNTNINNFYNGTLNLIFLKDLSGENNVEFNISNNNLTLNIEFSGIITNFNFVLNDNKNVNIVFDNIKNTTFKGSNNYLDLNFKNIISNPFSLFSSESYGNKIVISSITDNNGILTEALVDNNKMYGNYITVLSVEDKIGDLVNDNAEIFEYDEDQISQYMNFTIDEIHPKMFRDVSDIGTIIGWNAALPIPRGYYACDGSEIAVDLHNPNDEFYNGQLAYYLNGNLSTKTIKLPNLPVLKPSVITTDPFYCTDANGHPNFVPRNSREKLIYIIKYNNNFENKKGRVEIEATPQSPIPTPEPEPEPVIVEPTSYLATVDVNMYTYPATNASVQSTGEYWGGGVFGSDVAYTIPGGYITAVAQGGEKVDVSGTVTWTINRRQEEYSGQKNGYYQLTGLKTCIWSHQTTNIWAAQTYLYADFSNATINMSTGEIKNIIFHFTRHHNNADGGGGRTAHWQVDPVVNTLTFNPFDSSEQIILDKYGRIEPNTVCCWSKFTITVTQETIVIKALGRAWLQDGDNGNRSWVQYWQSPTDGIAAEFIISNE